MSFSRQHISKCIIPFIWGSTALHQDKTYCQESKPEFIAVYFKPESKKLLTDYMVAKGHGSTINHPGFVVLTYNVDKKTSYIYQPLYGERLAFRLKGLIKLDNGQLVGTGRISNVSGPLVDDDWKAALPFVEDETEISHLVSLPTRLDKLSIPADKSYWQGRLPSSAIKNEKYSATKANFTKIPFDQQILLEGYLCSNFNFVDGKCNFDRSKLDYFNSKDYSDTEKNLKKDETVPENSDKGNEPKECPLCTYLKGGNCAAEFQEWDKCMSNLKADEEMTKCSEVMYNMMKCMIDYEYYDIMMAGVDFQGIEKLRKERMSQQN